MKCYDENIFTTHLCHNHMAPYATFPAACIGLNWLNHVAYESIHGKGADKMSSGPVPTGKFALFFYDALAGQMPQTMFYQKLSCQVQAIWIGQLFVAGS